MITTATTPVHHIALVNGIRLHYLEYESEGPTLILMHGLTANAHAFDGLIAEGLQQHFRVFSIDLRGRGKSEQPATGYGIADHAADILDLMDSMKLSAAIIGGHSFGALLTLYLAANHPERVEKLVLLDAAARMHANTKEMLGPSLSRLGQTFDSFEAYLGKVKAAPFLTFWDEQMLSYYRADVRINADGTVTPIPQPAHMAEAVNGVLGYPWLNYIQNITQPAVLINGPGIYTMNAALLPEENARETVHMMQNCRYVKVPGNHQTMLYGEGAKQIVEALNSFLK